MLKSRKNKGFSLGETLIVVAIIVILAAVAFVTINRRSAIKRQYDEHAKEIFIAAQNHLSLADNLNYLGRTGVDLGTSYTVQVTPTNADDIHGHSTSAADGESTTETPVVGVYYLTAGDLSKENSVLNLMLPFGSIDETIRSGGKYIIEYHKDSGQVMNVFYWQENGSYPLPAGTTPSLSDLLTAAYQGRTALMNFGAKKAVVGYWGGVEAAPVQLERPEIWVENSDKLTVYVREKNTDTTIAALTSYQVTLHVVGDNGGSIDIPLTTVPNSVTDTYTTFTDRVYACVLDDVTTDGARFFKRTQGSGIGKGDLLKLKASCSSNMSLAASDTVTANSLYDDDTDFTGGTATISNIRHLENLSNDLSDAVFTKAEQTSDLDWKEFLEGEATVIGGHPYLPVTPKAGTALEYDGGRHTISNIEVSTGDYVGLFSTLNAGSQVYDLKLEGFGVLGSNAGALAGSVIGADSATFITNVLAVCGYDDLNALQGAATGATAAGGLIGELRGSCTVEKCAAAINVSGGTAGGLVGKVVDTDGTPSIKSSYAAGITEDGKHDPDPANFNVTGTSVAGGLVGSASGATITYCYATCSVTGPTAGGLVGSASGNISYCYAAGLVSGATEGAFAGTITGTPQHCYYYQIINQRIDHDTGVVSWLEPGADGVVALDVEDASHTAAQNYDLFIEAPENWKTAFPYDSALYIYFTGKYPLPTVARLGAAVTEGTDFVASHYGDWPAPEIVFLNR